MKYCKMLPLIQFVDAQGFVTANRVPQELKWSKRVMLTSYFVP